MDHEPAVLGCRSYLFCMQFLCESYTWLEVCRFRRVACWLRLPRRELLESRDCLLVVVTPSSGYVYCWLNWEILFADFEEVYCIVKDGAR